MLKIIKVTGRSKLGFSEAVRDTVEKLIQEGQKIHFFTVIEQRGAVRENKIKEFQVVMEVAVE